MFGFVDVGLISFITLIIGFMCGFLFGIVFCFQSLSDIIEGLVAFVYARIEAGVDEKPSLDES